MSYARILEQRDRLVREWRALENKVAGLNMAIAIVAEQDPRVSDRSGEADETAKTGSTEGESATRQGDAHPIPCDPTTPKQEGPNV